MMQPADHGAPPDRPGRWRFRRPQHWAVFLEPEMHATVVVIGDISLEHATQVPFTEPDHVVPTISPDRSDQPLYIKNLPGRLERRHDLPDPHGLDLPHEGIAVDAVTVPQQESRSGVPGIHLQDPECRPLEGRMRCHVKCTNRRDAFSTISSTCRTWQVNVGTLKKSIETISLAWLCRNALQVWDGGRVLPMSWRSSAVRRGLPRRLVRLSQRQKARNPRRCHRTMVSGVTISNGRRQPGQRRDRRIQSIRSRFFRGGRFLPRWRTWIW